MPVNSCDAEVVVALSAYDSGAVRTVPVIVHRIVVIKCAVAVHVLPDDVLADREALTACLAEQLCTLSRLKVEYLETHWEAEWEKEMAGKFVDLPNIQN